MVALGTGDVKLGMSQEEVRYVKGTPTEVLEERENIPVGTKWAIQVGNLDQECGWVPVDGSPKKVDREWEGRWAETVTDD